MKRNATRRWWRGWCCKCNTEKPMAGGTVIAPKGRPSTVRGGVVQRFICADCLAKRETANVLVTGARAEVAEANPSRRRPVDLMLGLWPKRG